MQFLLLSIVIACLLLFAPFEARGQTMPAPKTNPSAKSLPSAKTLPSPLPSLAIKTASDSISAAETAQINRAFELTKTGAPAAVLNKLIADWTDYSFTEKRIAEFKENLPDNFKSRLLITNSNSGSKDNGTGRGGGIGGGSGIIGDAVADEQRIARAERLAAAVFRRLKLSNRAALVYRSKLPLVSLYKGYYVLISTAALELLTDAELTGLIAHETAHLYWMDELQTALAAKGENGAGLPDYETARIIELKCDLIAALVLFEMRLDWQAEIRALEKMTAQLLATDNIKDAPTHPSLAARQMLAEKLAAYFRAQKRNNIKPGAAIQGFSTIPIRRRGNSCGAVPASKSADDRPPNPRSRTSARR